MTTRKTSELAAIAVLVAFAAAWILPTPIDAAAMALLLGLWLASRPSRRKAWVGGLGLSLTVVLAFGAAVLERLPPRGDDEVWRDTAAAYGELCDDLTRTARETAAAVRELEVQGRSRLEVFEYLHELTQTPVHRGLNLLYFNADGDAVAWAGDGLLHEPDPLELPASGLTSERGTSAVTLLATAPLDTGRRPSRLVAGRSFTTRGVPFVDPTSLPRELAEDVVWTLAPADAPTPSGDGILSFPRDDAPTLLVERRPGAGEPLAGPEPRHRAREVRRLAALVLAFTFLGLALLYGVPRGEPRRRPFVAALLAVAGIAAWSHEAALVRPLALALAGALGLALWGLVRERPESVRDDGGGAVLGGLALVALAVLAWSFQNQVPGAELRPLDLAADLGGRSGVLVRRLVGALAALGCLTLVARTRPPARGDGAAWTAVALLLAAGACHDLPAVALPLLALGGAAATRWLGGVDLWRRPAAVPAVLTLAALAGAASWEVAYREVFRQRVGESFLPLVAPPTLEETNDLNLEIQRHFESYDLARALPPGTGAADLASIDPQDLAFVLWRDSPLPRRDGASGVLVELLDGGHSSFAFGMPLDRDLGFNLDPTAWPIPQAPAWQDAIMLGTTRLELEGEAVGVLEYAFLPRPGFRLEVDEVAELEASLLRGAPRGRAIDGLPRQVLFAIYEFGGRALESPWEASPPLDPDVLTSPHGSLVTPSGRAWYWASEPGDDVMEVLYLPRLSLLEGLERLGTHALASLVALAGLAFWLFLVTLPREVGLEGLVRQPLRSYSIRLVLVYTALLLLPLVALNLVLLKGFEERLRGEQQENGRAALLSARLILLDYILGLDPGFGIDTEVHRGFLEWVSSVVHHQVNFYWRSELYASSQQELFTAGLLPRRIPGDVFSRLALVGHAVGVRTQHSGELDYGELYAPLLPGGNGAGAEQVLFLSLPLLEQEEGVARELATARRRAILVTTALFFLLLAVGGRLAASFTKPIVELIAGTREIADGAAFLKVTPRDRELEALADAIDEMARRIARGRRQLVLEKQVVERMVEHITSGVVSIDHERRVLMHNRVAAELLGTQVGAEICELLERGERLGPVAAFLAECVPQDASDAAWEDAAGIRHTTVQLPDPGGDAREWTLTWVPVPGSEDPAALLVVDDDTEVLRGQRLEAWAEMARIIAHEIKNPLTPIRLSTEHMQQVYRQDPGRLEEVFERCTTNILKQVEELRDIASDFSIYSRIPRAELVRSDLVAAMRELEAAYEDTARRGVRLSFESELEELRVRFDEKLFGRAVRNLLENALRASAGTAVRADEDETPAVVLRVESRDGRAVVSVLDSGPGVDPENLPKIFEPYFSTHETGTGLGLAIARRIVEEHGGRLEARNRPGGGLEVMITMPVEAAPVEETT